MEIRIKVVFCTKGTAIEMRSSWRRAIRRRESQRRETEKQDVPSSVVENITLTPQESDKRTSEGLVLRLVKPVQRPSKGPREYEVVGRRPREKRQRLRKGKRKKNNGE